MWEGDGKVWEPAGCRKAWEKGLLRVTKAIGLQKGISVNKREEIRFLNEGVKISGK